MENGRLNEHEGTLLRQVSDLQHMKSQELTQQQSIVHQLEKKPSNRQWFELQDDHAIAEKKLVLDEGFEPTKRKNVNFEESDGEAQ